MRFYQLPNVVVGSTAVASPFAVVVAATLSVVAAVAAAPSVVVAAAVALFVVVAAVAAPSVVAVVGIAFLVVVAAAVVEAAVDAVALAVGNEIVGQTVTVFVVENVGKELVDNATRLMS